MDPIVPVKRGSTRLLSLLRPYKLLFAGTITATVISSVLDGFTFVLLIPFLRTLFGDSALPAEGGSKVEAVLDKIAGPFLRAGTPEIALRNVVIVLLVALLLKNLTQYLSALGQVSIQEGVVRDLRVRLFDHLQRLPLGYFQRTRAGQTIARVISDTDQVKTAVSAALASLLQNVVVIIVYVVILFGLSVKLTLLSLLLAPVLLLIIRPMINRLRRRSRELATERGEVTSHVGEMIASAKLVRAYVAETFELDRFRELAERYRKRVLRAQRYSSLTSPVSEVFGGVMIVLILVVGTR
ncbi:MAG TPA: ABC transporter transmembrane domain-containing protein, partial [Gemmatimonadales bacterium]